MSSCTRVVRNNALSGLAVPSREGHGGVPLIFDVCALGFYKWSRGRLRLLGYDPIPSPYKYDDQIIGDVIEAFNSIVRGNRVACDAYGNGPNVPYIPMICGGGEEVVNKF